MSQGSTAKPDPQATQQGAAGHPRRTRTAGAYRGLVAGIVVLALLLVFILENTESVKISYLGASGHMALGVALLLAAVAGALLVGLVGTVRIMQLRRHVKRHAAGNSRGATGQ